MAVAKDMSRRPQFTLCSLLVAMLAGAAFFGGMAVQSCIEAHRRADRNDPSEDIIVFTARPGMAQPTFHKGAVLLRNR